MAEHQISLGFDADHAVAPSAPVEILEEIAKAWSLPIGEKIEVTLRSGDVARLVGKLELISVPSYPWDGREPLRLRITGFVFSNRDIEHWSRA